MELIKNTIRVGNSAGVLLPKEFLNTQVKIVLQPLNIEKDVLDILSERNLLSQVIGVYLAGSYARGEQTIDSDIDVLVITDNINDKIEKGKYDLMLVSKDLVDEKMKKDIFPLLPMMMESKPIINKLLLESYIKTKITLENIKWHIDTTKSAMNVLKEYIELCELDKVLVGDGYVYSLILRLRTIYVIDCLRKGKLWKKKGFLDLVKKISGSLTAYERYLESKNKNTKERILSIEEARKLMDYNNKKIREIEKWVKQKKGQERKG